MNFNETEEYLSNLKSVISGKIVSSQNNTIEEIHILADSSRNTKQICRDVQSVLITKFDMDIDYKKISIAQVSDKISFENNCRLKIISVKAENSVNTTEAKVVLEIEDKVFTGEASGIKTHRNTLRMPGEVALMAVEEYIGCSNCLILEDIEIVKLAGKEVVSSAVTLRNGSVEMMLCGTSFVEHSRSEAVVKATLNAINRRIEKKQVSNFI